jgi:outer membrane lipoprotein carrier protein
LLLAACGSDPPAASTTGSPATTASVPVAVTSSTGTVPTASGSASSAPTASATAPVASSSAPVADAGAPHDAGAKPPKVAASGAPTASPAAPDAGALAAADAGAASPALVVARQVDAIFGARKTFSARFKQTYTIFNFTGEPKTSSGTVMMERPNKISFRYDLPKKDRIVSDGVTIKVYMADNTQMTELPVSQTMYPGALAFMMGSGIAQSFDFAFNPRNKKDDVFVLDGKPLTPNPTYEQATFFLDKALLAKGDPGAMRGVTLLDATQNRNRFEFENVTQPDHIDPAEFTFTPPPGTDVKRQGP